MIPMVARITSTLANFHDLPIVSCVRIIETNLTYYSGISIIRLLFDSIIYKTIVKSFVFFVDISSDELASV